MALLTAKGISPVYAERAKGCRIWDVHGKEHVDWVSAVGSIILGDLFDYGEPHEGQPSMLERAHDQVEELVAGFECPHSREVQEGLRVE